MNLKEIIISICFILFYYSRFKKTFYERNNSNVITLRVISKVFMI